MLDKMRTLNFVFHEESTAGRLREMARDIGRHLNHPNYGITGRAPQQVWGLLIEAANVIENLQERLERDTGLARAQIDKLARFILTEVEGEPSESEGAVDTAIRVIRDLMAPDMSDEQWLELEQRVDEILVNEEEGRDQPTFLGEPPKPEPHVFRRVIEIEDGPSFEVFERTLHYQTVDMLRSMGRAYGLPAGRYVKRAILALDDAYREQVEEDEMELGPLERISELERELKAHDEPFTLPDDEWVLADRVKFMWDFFHGPVVDGKAYPSPCHQLYARIRELEMADITRQAQAIVDDPGRFTFDG
jgi:hypothetical protein